MSLLTNIDGVPLFSTIQEALDWGALYGITGYHTHIFQGQIGYMGGANHAQATDALGGVTNNTNY